MNKFKKILSAVLAIGLVASTIVLPVSVKADDASYGTKLIWNDYSDDAHFVDGTNGGENPTAANGFAGKDASDTIACHKDTHRPKFAGVWTYTDYVQVTYETKILLTEGSAATVAVWNFQGANNERATLRFADGKVYMRTPGDQYNNATTETEFTYDNNIWYKVAIVRTATTWEYYLNGEYVGKVDDTLQVAGCFTSDFGLDTITGTVYTDDYRIYTGDYGTMVDSPIAEVSGAVDGVITVDENTTVDQVKAMVTDGTATVYQSDHATVTNALSDGYVLIINKGELYKKYTIDVTGKYDGALYENKMDELSRVTALTDTTNTSYVAPEIVTNIAGRADNIAKIGTGNAKDGVGGWGQVWNTAGVMTVEAMVYNPNHTKIYIYPTNGGSASTANRLGVELSADGKVGYYHNAWTAVDTGATYNMDKWTKFAYTLDYTNQKMLIYVDGELVYTYSEVGMDSANFAKDIRFTPSSNSGTYLDNLRVYEGAYKGDEAITFTPATGISVADGVMKVAEGTTADAIAATFNADSVAIYADATGAATSAVADGAVVIANKGELYEAYTIAIQSPYGDRIVWNDMSTDGDINGFAGKASSDKVKALTAQYRPFTSQSSTNITSGQVSYEGKIMLTDGAKATFTVWNNAAYSERGTVRFADGKIYVRAAGDTYSNATTDTGYTYDNNIWYKVAVVKDAAGWTFYVNGVKVGELADAALIDNQYAKDFGFDSVTGTSYIDDMRMYTSNYSAVADEPIAEVADATNGVIKMLEGSTVADVTSKVTDGTATVYKSDLTTVSDALADGDVLIINKGELYKKYDIAIVTPYGDKLLWYDFTDAANATTIGGTQVNGFAGKAASDKVLSYTATTNRYYASSFASADGVVTYEASVFADGKCEPVFHIYNGGASEYRLAMKIYQDGSVQAGSTLGSDSSIWTPIAAGAATYGTAEIGTWNKVAIEWNAAAQYVKYYLNGTCIRTETITKETSRTSFNSQFAFEPTKVNQGYVDNMRVYAAPYVASEEPIAAVAGATNGVISMPMNSTLADVASKVTDGTATVYQSDLTTVSDALADGDVLIINKGELYKAYKVDVAGLYDDAYLLTGFESQGIVNEGSGFGTLLPNILYANNRQETNDEGETVNVSRKDEVTTSYVTGLGGKDSIVYKVVSPATETQRNVRFQTGYGNASTHVTAAGVYTFEADVYRGTAENSGASIMFKMRNTTDTNNMQITLPSPKVANRWYKLAITVDTVNKTIKGYVNGVDATSSMTYYGTDYDAETYEAGTLVFNGKDYTVVSDQVNVNFSESKTVEVVTATDNMRLYPGAYRGTTAPSMVAKVTMAANSTVADVIAETGADFVVDANGNVVSSTAAAVETGYQAVKVDGEMFGYTAIVVEVPATDVVFSPLAVGTPYTGKDGVEYVFVAITTGTIADISLYDTFRVTDGVEVKEIALSELMGTTLTGAAEIGVLVMNVPYANINSAAAKLVLAD